MLLEAVLRSHLLENGAVVYAVQKPSEEIDIKLLAF